MVTARRNPVVVQAVSPDAKRRDSALGKLAGLSEFSIVEDSPAGFELDAILA